MKRKKNLTETLWTEKWESRIPINVKGNLAQLTQRQFAAIAYEVMNEASSIYGPCSGLFIPAASLRIQLVQLCSSNGLSPIFLSKMK